MNVILHENHHTARLITFSASSKYIISLEILAATFAPFFIGNRRTKKQTLLRANLKKKKKIQMDLREVSSRKWIWSFFFLSIWTYEVLPLGRRNTRMSPTVHGSQFYIPTRWSVRKFERKWNRAIENSSCNGWRDEAVNADLKNAFEIDEKKWVWFIGRDSWRHVLTSKTKYLGWNYERLRVKIFNQRPHWSISSSRVTGIGDFLLGKRLILSYFTVLREQAFFLAFKDNEIWTIHSFVKSEKKPEFL